MSFSCQKREFDWCFNRLDRLVEESRPDWFPSLLLNDSFANECGVLKLLDVINHCFGSIYENTDASLFLTKSPLQAVSTNLVKISHIINFCFKRFQGQELIKAIYYRKLIKTEKIFFSGETYLANKRKNMKNSIFEKCCLCIFAKTCFK